jgi:SAM-dependent methyltransferase
VLPATGADPIAERNRATWVAGDFERIAVGYAAGAGAFVDRIAPAPGSRVLDVACGTGNLALRAAALGATVTGLDIAPALVDTARRKAEAAGLSVRFDEGNAEALPYGDASFDLVVSMFGVMFVPRPERALAELVRVTAPGGRIALANWIPGGFIGSMLEAHASRVPPPAGVPSPLAWGDEAGLGRQLDAHRTRIRQVRFQPRTIGFDYPVPPAAVVDLFREFYGPSVRTFGALDAAGRQDLEADLRTLWASRNTAGAGATHVEAEYLEVRIDVS